MFPFSSTFEVLDPGTYFKVQNSGYTTTCTAIHDMSKYQHIILFIGGYSPRISIGDSITGDSVKGLIAIGDAYEGAIIRGMGVDEYLLIQHNYGTGSASIDAMVGLY